MYLDHNYFLPQVQLRIVFVFKFVLVLSIEKVINTFYLYLNLAYWHSGICKRYSNQLWIYNVSLSMICQEKVSRYHLHIQQPEILMCISKLRSQIEFTYKINKNGPSNKCTWILFYILEIFRTYYLLFV